MNGSIWSVVARHAKNLKASDFVLVAPMGVLGELKFGDSFPAEFAWVMEALCSTTSRLRE